MSKLLRFPEVEQRVRLKRTAIYKLIKAAKFPAPVKQGGASFWFDEDIDAYLDGLKSARQASPTTSASS
jgi:predicted DNA-binding transcriptional regulator AlpA